MNYLLQNMKGVILNSIIFDENEVVENILNTNEVPNDLSMLRLIQILCQYFCYDGSSSKDIYNVVRSQLEYFHLPTDVYRPFEWDDSIKKCSQKVASGSVNYIREISDVPLYKSEVRQIESCNNRREKKIMAAFFFTSRMQHGVKKIDNSTYHYSNGLSLKTIFKLANVRVSRREQYKIINGLINNKKIGIFCKANEEASHIITLSPTTEKIVYKFTNPKNIGNQIVAFLEPKYMVCEKCGRLVKKPKAAGRTPKYCKKCAEEIQFEKKKEWDREKRKKSGKSEIN